MRKIMVNNSENQEITNISLVNIILKILPFTNFLFRRFVWIEQFLNFSIVGFFNTIISYMTYIVLVSFFIHPQIAGISGFITSITNAWLMNKYWVFKKNTTTGFKAPLKFIAVYGGNLLFGIVLIYLLYDCLKINKYIIPLVSLCVTVPVNYLLNRHWVFNGEKQIE